MKLSFVAAALGSLCFIHAGAFPVLEEDSTPLIIGPEHIQMTACPGEPLVLSCEAFPGCEDDLTLMYWLVNDSFPESLDGDRLVETKESTLEDGAIVQRGLLVRNVTSEDFRSTFVCVVTNPVGMALKHIALNAVGCDPRLNGTTANAGSSVLTN